MDFSSFTSFDQSLLLLLNSSESMFLDGFVLALTSGFTWILLYASLLYIVIKNNEKFSQISLIVGTVALGLLLTDGSSDGIVKTLVARPRPFNAPELQGFTDVIRGYRPDGYSFFSAHAANTMVIAIFFSLLVRNKQFTVTMLAFSLLNCWTRLYLGVHYPSDILVGIIWGLLCGLFIYMLYIKVYLRMSPELHYVSSQYTSTGYSLTDIDIVINSFVITLVYAIVRGAIYIF